MGHFGNPLTEYSPEMEALEFAQEFRVGGGGVFDEGEEMELAAELLEVSSEQELEQFLGDFIRKAGKAIGGIVKSPIGQAIGGVLKSAAKVALPIAGGALGTLVGGPLGTTIGSSLGSMAGKALGLELEGLSQEDREFEAARQFVRFAGEAVKNALQAPPNVDPIAAAKIAAAQAAREHAPGLLDESIGQFGHHAHHHHHHQGHWVRQGDKIVLYGTRANSERTHTMHEFDIPVFPHETESFEYSYPRVLSESQETELAAELMEVNSEQELEQFLGDLIKKAGSALGGLIKSPIGQALGGALKGVAKQVLPMAGQALGGMVGGPAGSQIGGQLASAAGSMFGLELEAGEQEFEAAQSFVRLAADAVKNAAAAPPGANPHAVAQAAVTQAAQVHAPGLFGPEAAGSFGPGFAGDPGRGRTGRWIRRGSKIILLGV